MPSLFFAKKVFRLLLILILLIGVFFSGIYVRHNEEIWQKVRKPFKKIYHWKNAFTTARWGDEFKVITIKTDKKEAEKAYFYSSTFQKKRPLLVSLHTWSGDFSEYDALAALAQKYNINYIHPDFKGANTTPQACCSDEVIQAIDDAIDFAVKNSNVDTNKIYITGASGGGYATLCMLMKSKHPISKFSAWVPVTDLEAWYRENKINKGNFANDILLCTNSGEEINLQKAVKRSPLYWPSSSPNIKNAQIYLYAGIYDGITGSVPITHTINFYNKLLKDQEVELSSAYVSDKEKAHLLEKRTKVMNYGSIADREIFLEKKYQNIHLIIFEGGHEMLAPFNIQNLLE
ncbi:alpha/beta hydrolase family protein [Ascidiimonas sp. W6]|uniref:alpha/beta hydrolase family protein n=1 Tax=Ascidiimonas meishanensis TaxID=3128903 RepID=UPI0030ED5D9A